MDGKIQATLKKLRLSGLLHTLDVRLHEASSHGLNHREFLELLLQDELLMRNDRSIQRRVTMAGFRDQKSLEDFDFTYNTSIKKSKVFDLATCHYVREKRDVLWVGRLGRARVISVRHWGCVRFAVDSQSTTGRSLTRFATSCMTKRWRGRIGS